MSQQIVTKETLIYTERKNNDYKSQDQINIYIPPSVAIINTKDLYIIANLKMEGLLKCCPGGRAGAYSLIRSIQISSGDGSTVLESLDNYAVLQALEYYYSQTDTNNSLRVLHEGKPSSVLLSKNIANQYLKMNEHHASSCFKNVELLLPIYLSGCLKPSRASVFPNIAVNGLKIQIQLNTAPVALQAIKGQTYVLDEETGANVLSSVVGGYDDSTGYAMAEDILAGATTLRIKNVKNVLSAAAGTRILQEANINAGTLFVIGQTIKVNGETKTLTGINGSTQNTELTFEPEMAENAPEDSNVSIELAASSSETDFVLSAVKMNVSFVESPGYVDKLIKQIQEGKFVFTLNTYTDYATNISADSLNNSLYINCRNNRAKAIISVPHISEAASYAEDTFIPDRGTVRDYQYILYSVLTPDRKVDLNRYNLKSFNAIALREQMLALSAAGMPVNSIKDPSAHFFVGRRLAMTGYSYNANREGEIRLNLNFKQVASLLMHNYVMHLRSVEVLPGSINIIY